MRFRWDEKKRLSNLDKHGLDFLDAELVPRGEHYSYLSHRKSEEWRVTVGTLRGRFVAVVWTERAGVPDHLVSEGEAWRKTTIS